MLLPEIVPADSMESTCTGTVTLIVPQPFVTTYLMTVVPATMPVIIPVLLTVATDGLLLVHTPPPTGSFNFAESPLHIVVIPVIVPAVGVSIVIILLAMAVPQLFVTE